MNCILNVCGWINLGEITYIFFQIMYKEIYGATNEFLKNSFQCK